MGGGMRIGVISDTHIPDRAKELPQQILTEFKKVDMIIHVGDLVDISVLEKLKSLCPNVKAVQGNMDHENVRKALPEKEVITVEGFKICVTHGHGSPSGLIELTGAVFKDERPDIIIFGHSHTAFNERIGNILFFNPGSCTDKIFSPYNSYGIIEINGKVKAKIIKL